MIPVVEINLHTSEGHELIANYLVRQFKPGHKAPGPSNIIASPEPLRPRLPVLSTYRKAHNRRLPDKYRRQLSRYVICICTTTIRNKEIQNKCERDYVGHANEFTTGPFNGLYTLASSSTATNALSNFSLGVMRGEP
jgi:hypothetical protein